MEPNALTTPCAYEKLRMKHDFLFGHLAGLLVLGLSLRTRMGMLRNLSVVFMMSQEE